MSRSVGTQVNADLHKYKRRRLKLKRINSVKRDLSDLQRVFVFEQEANEDRLQLGMRRGAPNTEAAKSRQASQLDQVLELIDERNDGKSLAEDVVFDVDNSTPEAFISSGLSRLSTFDEAVPLIEADEQWDMQSMDSCFTSLTSASSFQAEYENGRRYHGYCAGLYL